jgi:hypothetical protein
MRYPPLSTNFSMLREENSQNQFSAVDSKLFKGNEAQRFPLLAKADSTPRGSRICPDGLQTSHKGADYYSPSTNSKVYSHRHSMDERQDRHKTRAEDLPSRAVDLGPIGSFHAWNNLPPRSALKDEGSVVSWTDTNSSQALAMQRADANFRSAEMPAACRSISPYSSCLLSAVRNASLVEPTSSQDYRPLEKIMERKAIALGIRPTFFQILQKMRDLANTQHAGCNRQYKNWFADSLTWGLLCKRSSFCLSYKNH